MGPLNFPNASDSTSQKYVSHEVESQYTYILFWLDKIQQPMQYPYIEIQILKQCMGPLNPSIEPISPIFTIDVLHLLSMFGNAVIDFARILQGIL